MTDFKTGQKWISNAEPELGMGRVIRLQDRTVSLYFDAAAEERMYALKQAPLTRVKFNPGDAVATQDGITITVRTVVDKDGIYIYHGDYQGTDTAVVETELDANVRFSKPEDRLFTRQIDDNVWFNLRYHSLIEHARLASSKARGLYGPRTALIPHQLYIGAEVASRFAPRVLLADEVGLGKTIEAGLILHQQLQTGRASRVLVIVPPALTFQWFVEMIRRFNLQFTVLDEQRCQDIVADNLPEQDEELLEEHELETFNPFDAQQLMLCSLDLFTDNPDRVQEAVEAEFDLVIVDEAHHLHWTPEQTSDEYAVVEAISRASKGLLLLTATPEQLGRAGHFARLRLLDPNRFHDYDAFKEEEDRFEHVVNSVNALMTGTDAESAREDIRQTVGADDTVSDDDLIDALLDRHGTGRVLFRNIRSSVAGFPTRVPSPVFMEGDESKRLDWLLETLDDRPADKFLLITAKREDVVLLGKQIESRSAVRFALFHEGMDLVARDRAAAYFAESERGAQLLICSEIGSEGRNFQFANNLILFDLPHNPDVLEQRIGRLDRIGQLRDVNIYVPLLQDSPMAGRYRWYHEGLAAFERPNPVAQSLYEELAHELEAALEDGASLDELVSKTRALNDERLTAVNRGRDRLLEMNSHRSQTSAELVDDIGDNEGGEHLEHYMERSFEAWQLESEPLGDEVFLVKPTEGMIRHFAASLETQDHFHYPELPVDGIRITYDRTTALAREDVQFFTWEHPMVEQALDLSITDTTGNSAMIAIKRPDIPSGTLLVETLHVVDCVAPAELDIERFMPPQVLRDVVAPNLQSVAEQLPWTDFTEDVLEVDNNALHRLLDSQREGLQKMMAAARERAEAEAEAAIRRALDASSRAYRIEIDRLRALAAVNPSVRSEEIDYLEVAMEGVRRAIEDASVRLDAIRVIVAG